LDMEFAEEPLRTVGVALPENSRRSVRGVPGAQDHASSTEEGEPIATGLSLRSNSGPSFDPYPRVEFELDGLLPLAFLIRDAFDRAGTSVGRAKNPGIFILHVLAVHRQDEAVIAQELAIDLAKVISNLSERSRAEELVEVPEFDARVVIVARARLRFHPEPVSTVLKYGSHVEFDGVDVRVAHARCDDPPVLSEPDRCALHAHPELGKTAAVGRHFCRPERSLEVAS